MVLRSLSPPFLISWNLAAHVIIVRRTTLLTIATTPLRPVAVLLHVMLLLMLLLSRSSLSSAPRATALLHLRLSLVVSLSFGWLRLLVSGLSARATRPVVARLGSFISCSSLLLLAIRPFVSLTISWRGLLATRPPTLASWLWGSFFGIEVMISLSSVSTAPPRLSGLLRGH